MGSLRWRDAATGRCSSCRTHDTGGRVIDVGNNGNKLRAAFDQIQDELRTQYLLSYTPKDQEFNGKFRPINLDCGNQLKVDTRKGYYAIAEGDNRD